MRHLKNSLIIIGILFLSGMLINAVQSSIIEKKEGFLNNDKPVKDYNVYAIDLPKELFFAGEPVPLSEPDIRERIDREFLVNTYWQSNTFLLLKRANKYFPVIEPILKENGVPDDFKYLAVIESGLQNVVSPAKATGFWQLLSATGKEYGMEINENVDERYHIVKSTRVACEYLKDAKKRFGSWTLAAAAYNAGKGGIQKQFEKQKESNYYDLLFGEETERYVFRILAVKEILSNPQKYGFNIEKKDLYTYIPTYTVEVDTSISDIADFAKKMNINYKTLKIHNPWLRDAFLTNKTQKKYTIEIPKEGYYQRSK